MRSNWVGDLIAGIGAGIAFVPMIVVIGIITFGALGPQIAAEMSAAVFAANLIGGTVIILIARCPVLVGGTSGSSALVVAALFARLTTHGSALEVADVMAITLAVGTVVSVVQFSLIWAGAAGLGPLAPYPVVAGLVNGTAVLLLLSQIRPLLVYPAEIVVAAATTATMLTFPARWKVPPVLPAIGAGTAVFAVLEGLHLDAGPVLTAMPSPIAYPAMAAGALTALWWHFSVLPWSDILVAGVTIALLGVLDTLATVSAVTDAGLPTDGRRALNAVGLGNLAVALTAGGPAVSATVGGTLGLMRMGATGPLAPISRLVTMALGSILLGGFLPLVPQGAMAGLVIAIGYLLLDREPVRLLWRAARQDTPHRLEIAGSALISLTVVAVAVFAGLAVAVAIGAAACLLVFTAAMAGSAVRRVYDGAAALSRVRRSVEETAVLLRQRRAVAVLELAGPLFFGNISPLGRALDEARASGARYIVIDLSRIVRVDLSGARRLVSIVRQSRQNGGSVVSAPIRPGNPVADYLAALGVETGECFAELTDALGAAEAAILLEAGIATPSFATAADALIAFGVAHAHARTLASYAEIRDLAAGEVLCRGGEPADALFVLMQGEVDVVLPRSGDAAGPERLLLAHLSAGTVIGERALFQLSRRSADVNCTVQSRVLIMSETALVALMRDEVSAYLALVLAIAEYTSVNLQMANAAIQRLEV